MAENKALERSFAACLRSRREQAGLSLAEFARLAHYSKGHISKIENSIKPPSQGFARRCDAVLGTGGAFVAMVAAPPHTAPTVPASQQDEVWVMSLSAEGRYEFGSLRPGEVVTTGIMGWTLGSMSPYRAATGAVGAYRVIFDQLRLLGQTVGPTELVPSLVAATNALRVIAGRATPSERRDGLRLASRFAEYTGWMAQEKGDERAALWWTNHAVDLAKEGEDDELLAYAHVRRALVALYRHDPIRTVELAQRAQEGRCHPRILGLAAQREAQGHAIAGNEAACRHSLDRAADLLATAKSAGPDDAR